MYLPFRMTRDYWRIPLYCVNRSRPDSHIDVTTVQLSRLDPSACIMDNFVYQLFEPHEVVIPDSEFTLLFNSPFRNAVEIPIKLHEPPTLRVLLIAIQSVLKRLYEIERSTSTATEYTIQEDCEDCETEQKNQMNELEEKTDYVGDCTICYNPYESAVQLKCSHIFHKSCLSTWMSKGNPSCPLCRSTFVTCSSCNNTRSIERTSSFIEIPRELSYVRNETNGIYGIHVLHYEDLCVESIWYNKHNRILQVFVCCAWEESI